MAAITEKEANDGMGRTGNTDSAPAPVPAPVPSAGLEDGPSCLDEKHAISEKTEAGEKTASGETAKAQAVNVSGTDTTDVDDDEDGSGTETATETAAAAEMTAVVTRGEAGDSGGAPIEPWRSAASMAGEIPDEVYNRLSTRRKITVVALMSYCSTLAPISSTAVLPAVPDVATEFGSTGTVVDISNALYMLFMGLSPVLWGPLSEVYGRRWITISTALLLCLFSMATALAPNLASYFIFRILTAFEGTAFLLVGAASISDIYRPTERATAMGWFLSGTLVGPALGPFFGGIIVTYKSWRVIFWLQTALAGAALVGTVLLLPETIHRRKIDSLAGLPRHKKARALCSMINPMRVLRLYMYPNVIIVGLASSSLVWNMYSLLTPIRYVLNPRFHLTTPMQSGLFYLAPGCGYLLGTFFGGRYADHMVRRWIVRRGGVRVPEDRLRSALPFMGIVIPGCMLIYGWGIDQGVGGIPLAVITMFLQGVAQLFCFPSLNTYCLDVMQRRGSEVIAGNYFIRYLFAAAATAVVLPGVEGIGIGWFSTVSALFLAASAAGVYANIIWGHGWQERVDRWRAERRKAAYLRKHGPSSPEVV